MKARPIRHGEYSRYFPGEGWTHVSEKSGVSRTGRGGMGCLDKRKR